MVQADGDFFVAKLFPLFQTIILSFEKEGKNVEGVWNPQLKPPSPLTSPSVLKPSSLSEGQLVAGRSHQAQGCFRLSNTPPPPLYPCQDGTGHALLGLSSTFLPMLTYPVISPTVHDNAKDGAGNMASPAVLSPSHASFPALVPQNGHFPASTPSLPATPCSSSLSTASLGVTALGPSPSTGKLLPVVDPSHAPSYQSSTPDVTPTSSPPNMRTGSQNGGNRKEAILASSDAHKQASTGCRKQPCTVIKSPPIPTRR